jgi:hypothetical protein
MMLPDAAKTELVIACTMPGWSAHCRVAIKSTAGFYLRELGQ